MRPREAADARRVRGTVDGGVVVASHGFVGEGGREASFVPAGVVRASIAALRNHSQ